MRSQEANELGLPSKARENIKLTTLVRLTETEAERLDSLPFEQCFSNAIG